MASTRSEMQQIREEAQKKSNSERIGFLENRLASAHKRLDVQREEIDLLAAKVLDLEKQLEALKGGS